MNRKRNWFNSSDNGLQGSALKGQALAGLLCDGRVRDFGELARQEPVIYYVGETTRWGGDVPMLFEANCS